MTYPSRQGVITGLIITAALTLAACGGGDSGSTNGGLSPNSSTGSLAGQTITLYNGQHEQTTDALVKAFESATGVRVNVRNDDEDVLAQQIGAGGLAVAGRCVLHREHTASCAPRRARVCSRRWMPPTLAKVPAKYSATDHSWVGVSARLSMLVYNTDDLQPAELPTVDLRSGRPEMEGQAGHRSGGDRLRADRYVDRRKTSGDAAAVAWLKAIKENAGAHQDPDNETLVANVNKGVTELGVINHYYWYRLRAEVGDEEPALGASHLRQRVTPATCSTSPVPAC